LHSLTHAGVLVTARDEASANGWPWIRTGWSARRLLARSKAELDLAHLEIEHAGGTALRLRADVTDFEQVSVAVERMRATRAASTYWCARRRCRVLSDRSPMLSESLGRDDADESGGRDERVPRRAVAHDRAALGEDYRAEWAGAANPRPNFSAYAASKRRWRASWRRWRKRFASTTSRSTA